MVVGIKPGWEFMNHGCRGLWVPAHRGGDQVLLPDISCGNHARLQGTVGDVADGTYFAYENGFTGPEHSGWVMDSQDNYSTNSSTSAYIPSDTNLNGLDAITIGYYVYYDADRATDPRVITRQSTTSSADHKWMFGLLDSGSHVNKLRSRINISGTVHTIVAAANGTAASWVCAFVTWMSGARPYLHRDGSLRVTSTPTTPISGTIVDDTSVQAAIGNSGTGGNNRLDGKVAWVGLWDYYWPDEQMLAVMDAPMGFVDYSGFMPFIPKVAAAPPSGGPSRRVGPGGLVGGAGLVGRGGGLVA